MDANWSAALDRWFGGWVSRWTCIIFLSALGYLLVMYQWISPVSAVVGPTVGALSLVVGALLLAFSLYRDVVGGLLGFGRSQERLNRASERRVRTLVRTRHIPPLPPRLRRTIPFSTSALARYDVAVSQMRTVAWGRVEPAIPPEDVARVNQETRQLLSTLPGNWSALQGPIEIYARMPEPWCWIGAAVIMWRCSHLRNNFFAPTGIRQALYFLAEAHAVDPDNVTALLLRATLLQANGDPKRLHMAQQTLVRVQLLAPDNSDVSLAEARQFLAIGRYDLAEGALQEATRRSRTPDEQRRCQSERALLLLSAKRFEEAAVLYRELLAEHEQRPGLWHNLSAALYGEQSYDEALAASDRALALMEFDAARTLNTALRRRLGMTTDTATTTATTGTDITPGAL